MPGQSPQVGCRRGRQQVLAIQTHTTSQLCLRNSPWSWNKTTSLPYYGLTALTTDILQRYKQIRYRRSEKLRCHVSVYEEKLRCIMMVQLYYIMLYFQLFSGVYGISFFASRQTNTLLLLTKFGGVCWAHCAPSSVTTTALVNNMWANNARSQHSTFNTFLPLSTPPTLDTGPFAARIIDNVSMCNWRIDSNQSFPLSSPSQLDQKIFNTHSWRMKVCDGQISSFHCK